MSAPARFACAALVLAALPCLAADSACKPNRPCYSADHFVNGASNEPVPLAPFTWARVYGENLSYTTASQSPDGVPQSLAGVQVLLNSQPVLISYVSPVQINFLMPFTITAQEATVRIIREGVYGPAVKLVLDDCSPEVFQTEQDTVVAAHATWTVIAEESPARPEEIIIFYATGLGQTEYPLSEYQVPGLFANSIARRSEFKVLLNGEALPDHLVEYAGAAPLFIGVYQINLKLPKNVARDPELRIQLGDRVSKEGLRLIVR